MSRCYKAELEHSMVELFSQLDSGDDVDFDHTRATALADLAILMCEKRKAAYHQVAAFMDTTTK